VKSKELAKITGGKLRGNGEIGIRGFEFDSRRVQEGIVFVPLRGKRDGHQFIDDALKKGAAGYLTEKGKVTKSNFFIGAQTEGLFSCHQ
jgi:UDP-N-acetylmuramoyl-tripeptide--D-alanyl-D-alanine ligase